MAEIKIKRELWELLIEHYASSCDIIATLQINGMIPQGNPMSAKADEILEASSVILREIAAKESKMAAREQYRNGKK